MKTKAAKWKTKTKKNGAHVPWPNDPKGPDFDGKLNLEAYLPTLHGPNIDYSRLWIVFEILHSFLACFYLILTIENARPSEPKLEYPKFEPH